MNNTTATSTRNNKKIIKRTETIVESLQQQQSQHKQQQSPPLALAKPALPITTAIKISPRKQRDIIYQLLFQNNKCRVVTPTTTTTTTNNTSKEKFKEEEKNVVDDNDIDGETFFLVNFKWWCDWCRHVQFFPDWDTNMDMDKVHDDDDDKTEFQNNNNNNNNNNNRIKVYNNAMKYGRPLSNYYHGVLNILYTMILFQIIIIITS